MPKTLRGCPFCGHEAHAPDVGKDTEVCDRQAECPICGACGPQVSGGEMEAIEAWNRRVERTCIVQEKNYGEERDPAILYVCNECEEVLHGWMKFCPGCGARIIREREGLIMSREWWKSVCSERGIDAASLSVPQQERIEAAMVKAVDYLVAELLIATMPVVVEVAIQELGSHLPMRIAKPIQGGGGLYNRVCSLCHETLSKENEPERISYYCPRCGAKIFTGED